jgi:hypothetical protein
MMIAGQQCIITLHVDDLIFTQVNQEVLDHVVSEQYGKEDPLLVHKGDVHDYLGMPIDFSSKGVDFRMVDYIQNMLDELSDDSNGTAATAEDARVCCNAWNGTDGAVSLKYG